MFLFVISKLFPVFKRGIRKRKYEKLLEKSGIKDIDKMDGFQFEVFLKVLFKQLGYKPVVTKKSGDFGADLILLGKNKIVIQAKRYGYKNNVSLDAVREIYAAKAFYQADEAWVITNSFYTKQAIELAKACHVKLLDRHNLQKFIIQVNPEQSATDIYNTIEPANRKCSVCGNEMIVRVSKKNNSRFFGCSNFPNCTHTEKISA